MKNNLIFKLFNCFIAFVLIPVILLNISIIMLIQNIKASTIASSVNNMSQSQFFMNQIINDSIAAVHRLSNNSAIYKLSTFDKDLALDDYGDMLKAGYAQAESVSSLTEAFAINILFHKNDILLTPYTICSDLEKFYGTSFKFGELSLSDLERTGSRNTGGQFYPYSGFVISGIEQKGIMYSSIMTEYSTDKSGSTALIIINEDSLINILSGFNEAGGMAYIMDHSGLVLYEIGTSGTVPISFTSKDYEDKSIILPDEIFGKDQVAFYSQTVLGLQIVAVIPEDALFLQVNNLMLYAWILNGATIIMCTILFIMVAMYNSRQIDRTLAFLPEYEHSKGENKKESIYSLLQHSIGNLVNTNTSLGNALNEQQFYARSAFWEKIASSDTITRGSIESLCQNAGMILNADGYCVLLIFLTKTDDEQSHSDWVELLQARKNLMDRFNEISEFQGYTGNIGVEQTVLLCRFAKDETKDYRNVLLRRISFLQKFENGGFRPICIGSNLFSSSAEIPEAYSNCRNFYNLLPYCQNSLDVITWCEDIYPKTDTCFYYGDETKGKIIIGIKSGQVELIKTGFHRILSDNFLDRQISAEMRSLLIAKLKMTLMEAYDSDMEVLFSQVLECVDSMQTDASLISFFLRTAIEMSEYYIEKIDKQDRSIKNKIIDYINENFCEYSFCLASTASHCGLSESYFSLIFKENIGENFSSYVEKLRMSYAKQLLQSSELTVDDISKKIGYSTTNAFRKAFKRFYEMSPIQMRKTGGK